MPKQNSKHIAAAAHVASWNPGAGCAQGLVAKLEPGPGCRSGTVDGGYAIPGFFRCGQPREEACAKGKKLSRSLSRTLFSTLRTLLAAGCDSGRKLVGAAAHPHVRRAPQCRLSSGLHGRRWRKRFEEPAFLAAGGPPAASRAFLEAQHAGQTLYYTQAVDKHKSLSAGSVAWALKVVK